MLIHISLMLLYSICSIDTHECLVNTLIDAETARDSGVVELEVHIYESFDEGVLSFSTDVVYIQFIWKDRNKFVLKVKEGVEEDYNIHLACDGNYVWTYNNTLWEYAFLTHRNKGYDTGHIDKFVDMRMVLDHIVLPHIMPLSGFMKTTYLKEYYKKIMSVEENSVMANGASKLVLNIPDAPHLKTYFFGNSTQCEVTTLITETARSKKQLLFAPDTANCLPATISTGHLVSGNDTLSWRATLRSVGLLCICDNKEMLDTYHLENIDILHSAGLTNKITCLSQMNLLQSYGGAPIIRFDWSKVYDLSFLQGLDLSLRLLVARVFVKEPYGGYVWAEETEMIIEESYTDSWSILPIHFIVATLLLQILAIIIWFTVIRKTTGRGSSCP